MTNNDELALKLKAAAEVIATEHYTDDQWFHYLRLAHHSNILALLAERDADKKRIADLVESHKQLREAMAMIHNTIRMDGAYTPLSAIMSRAKRAYEESAAAAGINLEVGE
ncbi:hypothetical protein N7922_05785 [Kosakonia sp. ML.JS2a]|uniref:hypothetical protein n=1 Tax=Kosakonia sp. ML.JS2a TaxID=2980557 RepID=UPI0021DB0BC2|nr:hypothetical protein [Kosakonia sp. ML.JS2a]UXY12037.1 hypothetical protein N7922_05785 [Kosakonia sp. ML.JS2a]